MWRLLLFVLNGMSLRFLIGRRVGYLVVDCWKIMLMFVISL